jgi:hypothetical protein
VDNTGELAALLPRPGGAGSNTAKDLIDVLRAGILQIPADRRGDLLITSDGAGASHPLIGWLHSLDQATGRRVEYSVGFDVDEYVRAACNRRPDDWWLPCLSNTTGEITDGLECCEITDLMRERDVVTWLTLAAVWHVATGALTPYIDQRRLYARTSCRQRMPRCSHHAVCARPPPAEGLGNRPDHRRRRSRELLGNMWCAADRVTTVRCCCPGKV